MREMKDSGILGYTSVPVNWKITKIKYITKFKSGVAHEGNWDFEGKYIIVNSRYVSTNGHTKCKYSENALMPLVKGDICIVLSDLPNGRALARCMYIYENNKFTLNQRVGAFYSYKLYGKFFQYAMDRNVGLLKYDDGMNQTNLQYEDVYNCKLVIPNFDEQVKIADYLDNKCAEIDSLISDIQQQIEILEEYKKCLIFHTISKGIIGTQLKETLSDVWTMIPKNWKLIDIKYIFKIVKQIAMQEGFDVLSVTQKGLKVKDIYSNNGQQAESYEGYQFVYPNDYVMNHMDLLTGWVDCSTMFGVTSPDYRVFRLRDRENNSLTYFKYVMQCCYMCRIFYTLGQGVSNLGRWRLQTSVFNNFMIPVPPLDEQLEISEYLDTKISEIDSIINSKQKQIKTIDEYKKSLIFEYVTGKKEVIINDT